MYTTEEIESIRSEACKLGLEANSVFWDSPPEYLCRIVNGCGSADMSETSRAFLTWLYRNYAPAVAIHDCDFEESDGTGDGLTAANMRFRKNCFILWESRYGRFRWINPVALWSRNKIRLACIALDHGSQKAWHSNS